MQTLSILAQGFPAAGVVTDLFTAPAACAVSSVTICNQGTASTFRLAVSKSGEADAPKQYVYFNEPIPANRTFVATIGLSLASGDVIRAQSANGACSFNVFGVTQ